MAGDIYEKCFECGADCISAQFCSEGYVDASSRPPAAMPKHLKIKVIANPNFWGFGSLEENVLISGWAFFKDGHYDFFDGYDETHFQNKICGSVDYGLMANEQRPDVLYRSVYTPTGVLHYGSNGYLDGIERGGAEVYLIDQEAGGIGYRPTSDSSSCDDQDPTQVYKKIPENFGLGNKIQFTNEIYKNATGAWRLVDVETPNVNNLMESIHIGSVCNSGDYEMAMAGSGSSPVSSKQSIIKNRGFLSNYDPFRFRASGEYPNCLPDGSVVGPYKGSIESIIRDTGVSNLIKVVASYNNSSASGLISSSRLYIDVSEVDNNYTNLYNIIGVEHSGSNTSFYLIGTFGENQLNLDINGSGYWVLGNSYDPETCCSKFGYGIDSELKKPNQDENYHLDFGRIFNNAKNIRQSNRFPENRNVYPLESVSPSVGFNSIRVDKSYISVNSGVAESGLFEKKLPYYGAFYETDIFDYAVRQEQAKNLEFGKNYTCATKRNTLDVFPACISQYYGDYEPCGGGTAWATNKIPRFSFVYRGANFYDSCNFDEQGLPFADWSNSPPTGIDQLRNGLGGLEINMFINIGDVRGSVIVPEIVCDCDGIVPGVTPPIWDAITSPITFPSFPKYDLYPEQYGCQDPQFQLNESYSLCGVDESLCCGYPELDWVCNVKQPYTTYGYIRSLCGQKSDDRIRVITEGFRNTIQAGAVRNTTPGSGIDQPVYWEFNNPDVMFSGSAAGNPTFVGTGNYPFWGIADDAGRLVAPYFNNILTTGNYTECGNVHEFTYLKFDSCYTAKNGWPTNNVPFLIEIDHDDSCVDCSTTQMESGSFTATLTGLGTEYSYDAEGKHGFNYCLYKGVRDVPTTFTCESGWADACAAYSGWPEYSAMSKAPYVGPTCPMATGQTVTLDPIYIKNSEMLLGWSTWGIANSFVKVSATPWVDNFIEKNDNIANGARDGIPYSAYVSMKLSCESTSKFLYKPYPSGYVPPNTYYDMTDPVRTLLDSDFNCSHHYPSADSDLKLTTSFCLVADAYEDIFNLIPEPAMRLDLPTLLKLEDYIRFDIIDQIKAQGGLGCSYDVIENGCLGVDSYGASGFYPCNGVGCVSGGGPSKGFCECGACCNCGEVKEWGTVSEGWYGPCTCECNESLARVTSWDTCSSSGTVIVDIVGTGCNFATKSIAFSGDFGYLGPIYYGHSDYDIIGYGPYSTQSESACRWKQSINNIESGVLYYINKPQNQEAPAGCGLTPYDCEQQDCAIDSNVNAGLCGKPIPFAATPSGLSVVRKSCYPEIMIVSKIECLESGYLGDGYRLRVSREYHHHDRTWKELKIVPFSSPVELACYTKAYGGYSYEVSGCESIPYAVPSDGVTPSWGADNPCLVSQPSGDNANQDFLFTNKPSPSGDTLWNYYNLFYESGFTTGNGQYLPSLTIGGEETGYSPSCPSSGGYINLPMIFNSGLFFSPVGTSGVLAVNSKHSCLQDQYQCGGELYCNKMFFPRRSHDSGTVVTKFGSMQTCTANAINYFSPWHEGYQDLGITDLQLETENIAPFIDTCDETIQQYLIGDIGIDTTYLIVNDVLPLMGLNRNKFRYLGDVKSCLLVNYGCIPVYTHSDQSILAGLHLPKTFANNKTTSFGYYLQKSVATSSDSCLFIPFKIMVDVDCCTSNIRRKNTLDDPSNLDYILTSIPSPFCGGMIKTLPCGNCENTVCGGSLPREDQPDSFTCISVSTVAWKIVGEDPSSPISDDGSCPQDGFAEFAGAYSVEQADEYEYFIGCTPTTAGYAYYKSSCDICNGASCIPVGICCNVFNGVGYVDINFAVPHNLALVEFGGNRYLVHPPFTIWTWGCAGNTYIDHGLVTSVDPGEECCFVGKECGYLGGTGGPHCCQDKTICELLNNAYVWDGSSCIALGGTLGQAAASYNAQEVFLNPECGCSPVMRYQECDNSMIRVNLTQE